jgi:hypothetical protein
MPPGAPGGAASSAPYVVEWERASAPDLLAIVETFEDVLQTYGILHVPGVLNKGKRCGRDYRVIELVVGITGHRVILLTILPLLGGVFCLCRLQ